MGKKYYRKKNDATTAIIALGVLAIIAVIGILLSVAVPLLLVGGVGYGIYRLATRKSSLDKKNLTTRLQDLKDTIGRTDRQIKLLDHYLDEKDYNQYAILGRQLLPQLETIQVEADRLKPNMDLAIYKRISQKVTDVTSDIETQLEGLNIAPDTPPASKEEREVMDKAPELLTIYRNIQNDHLTILNRIKESKPGNQAELTALHEAEMTRFRDILQGYLRIKASPKDFHKADQRLEQARLAMETFDRDLDETLKELNEGDLQDFEISLRMMSQKNKQTQNPLDQ